jgi:hypothetical protein
MKVTKDTLKRIIKEEYNRLQAEAWGSRGRSSGFSGYRTNPQTGEREQWTREPGGGGYWSPVNPPKEKPLTGRSKEWREKGSQVPFAAGSGLAPENVKELYRAYVSDPQFGVSAMDSAYQRWARGQEVSEEEWQKQIEFTKDISEKIIAALEAASKESK